MTAAEYMTYLHNDPVIYALACAVLALCVWIFGYWIGVARGRFLERQVRETCIDFQADTVHICTHGVVPVITPMRTVRTANADPGAYADFGSN